MKIAVFGATGMVGSRIAAEAEARGHEVTALSRSTGADMADAATVREAAASHDVVVSATGPSRTGESHEPWLASVGTLIENAGDARVLFVGGAGSLIEPDGSRGVDSPHFPAAWKEGALGAADALDLVRQVTDLDWTFVSPATMLNPGEKTGKYRLGRDSLVKDAAGASNFSDGDLAHVIIDEIEKPKHIRQRFTLGY